MAVATVGFAMALAVATAASFTGGFWPWGGLLADLRIQFFVTSVFLLASALVVSRSSLVLVLTFVAFMANAAPVLPQITVRAAEATPDGPTLNGMVLNLLFGQAPPERVAGVIEEWQPDIIAFTEINRETDAQYGALLRERYPFTASSGRIGTKELRIFSRYRLSDVAVRREGVASPVVTATVNALGAEWRMIAFHAPSPLFRVGSRDIALKKVAEIARSEKAPYFVAGDLNVTPWSPVFADMLAEGELKDSGLGHRIDNTWLMRQVPFGLPIDHVLVSKDISVAERAVSSPVGSDHRALFARLVLPYN